MNDELLNNALFEQVNELMHQNMDVIINTFESTCPDIDHGTQAAAIEAIRLSTQLALYTVIKLLDEIGLLKLPEDGKAILKPLD